jgi:hypothetical protein
MPLNLNTNEVTGVDLNNTEVSEVRLNGQTVFTAGPDIPASAVLNLAASDYSGSNWPANIGPDVPDAFGNPTKTTDSNGGTTFDVVEYDDNPASQNNAFSTSGTFAIIAAFRYTSFNGTFNVVFDGGSRDEAAFLNENTAYRIHFDGGPGVNSSTSLVDTNWHVAALESRSGGRLLIDGNQVINYGSGGTGLSGITIGSNSSNGAPAAMHMAELTVLENHTQTERDDEISRLSSEYNI